MANPLDRVMDRVDDVQRSRAWTGFAFGVIKKFGDDQAGSLAALVAYYGFFSIFPLLLVLVTTLGFVLSGNEGARERLVDSALAQFPVIGPELGENVGAIEGSGLALGIGLGGALWAGLGAMNAAQQAMNSVWDVPLKARPNFLLKRVRALAMLVVLGGGIVASTVLANVTAFGGAPSVLGRVAVVAVTAAVNAGIFLLAYRVLTDLDLAWRELVPGALVAGLAWTVLQLVGGWFVTRQLSGASHTYGVFGVVIGLLSWLYLVAQVSLFAAEINVVRARRLWPRSLTGRHLTEADERALQGYAKVEERLPRQQVESVLHAEAPDGTEPS